MEDCNSKEWPQPYFWSSMVFLTLPLPSQGDSTSPPLEPGEGFVITLTECGRSDGWVIKGNMTSSGNLFVRMLTLGTQSPSYKKTQVTWRGHMQASWLIAQLRSQLTVVINCQVRERMSLQMILASSIWVTAADAAWSKAFIATKPCPNQRFMRKIMLFFLSHWDFE